MRQIWLKDIKIVVEDFRILTTFPDYAVSAFWPPIESWEYRGQAFGAGYCDAMQFGIEHDLTHSFLAFIKGKRYSEVVWAHAHNISQSHNQKLYDDEEHIVYRMQRYINTGQEDTDYGLLRKQFGDLLPGVAIDLLKFLRFNYDRT